MHFDRFDICEAYLALEQDYNLDGWLRERPSNMRRRESTDVQLHRMGFKPGAFFNGFETLSENGKEIYRHLEERYGFIKSGYCDCACRDCFDIAIGLPDVSLCNACEEAGCERGNGECQREDAYEEGEGEEP